MRWRFSTSSPDVNTTENRQPTHYEIIFPQLKSDRCVHAASPLASCETCSQVCPRQAWHVARGLPHLDEALCDGCGLCYAACPERAIDLPVKPALRQNKDGNLTAFVACARGVKEEGMVPCLHALSMSDLRGLVRQGVTRIVASNNNCSDCAAPPALTLDQMLNDFNAIQRSRAAPVLHIESLPAKAWQRTLQAHRKRANMPDPSRRRFLGLKGVETEPSRQDPAALSLRQREWLYANIPEIDVARCNGCDACVRLCPHGALQLTQKTAEFSYTLDPDQCTGCKLCQDICDQSAVSVRHMAKQLQHQVPLKAGRCSLCGVPFHVPEDKQGSTHTCRICSNKGKNNRLFQVIK